jgi:hypothetical protein
MLSADVRDQWLKMAAHSRSQVLFMILQSLKRVGPKAIIPKPYRAARILARTEPGSYNAALDEMRRSFFGGMAKRHGQKMVEEALLPPMKQMVGGEDILKGLIETRDPTQLRRLFHQARRNIGLLRD